MTAQEARSGSRTGETVIGHVRWTNLVSLRLWWGRDRAVKIGDLAEQLGTSRRQIERAIESLRMSGTPICSGEEGVWLSKDARELRANVDALRRRALTQMVTARALRETARRYAAAKVEQLEVWQRAR